MYLLVFHAYIKEAHDSRSKIPSKKSRPYICDDKFLALIGAPYIYDISRLRVNIYKDCTLEPLEHDDKEKNTIRSTNRGSNLGLLSQKRSK
jgi:hypothetical protein